MKMGKGRWRNNEYTPTFSIINMMFRFGQELREIDTSYIGWPL